MGEDTVERTMGEKQCERERWEMWLGRDVEVKAVRGQ